MVVEALLLSHRAEQLAREASHIEAHFKNFAIISHANTIKKGFWFAISLDCFLNLLINVD